MFLELVPSASKQQIQETGLQKSNLVTPWKINMEPTNHTFRKENDLPNLHDYPCESSGVYDGFV